MAHVGQELTLSAGRGFGGVFGLLQLFLRSLALSDVARNSVNPLLFSEGCCIPCEPFVCAVFAKITVLKGDDLDVARGQLRCCGERRRAVFGMNKVKKRFCQKFLFCEAERFFPRWV